MLVRAFWGIYETNLCLRGVEMLDRGSLVSKAYKVRSCLEVKLPVCHGVQLQLMKIHIVLIGPVDHTYQF